MGGVILGLSLAIQIGAAVLAFRLLRATAWRWAWGTVAAALLLMAGRRAITLHDLTLGATPTTVSLSAELVALAISGLMLAGVWLIGPRLRSARATESALRSNERRLRALLEHLPDAVCLVTPEGRIRSVNAALERIVGVPGEDLVGRDALELLHPGDRERAGRRIQALFAGEELSPGEFRFGRGEDPVPVEGWSRVVELEEGPVLLTAFRDLRERKRQEAALRRSQRRFISFMEHLPAIAFIKDTEGRHVYANGPFEQVLELEPGAWEDRRNDELFPADTAATLSRHDREVLESGEPRSREERVVTAEGERIFRTERFPIFGESGSVSLLGGIALDVTEQRRSDVRHRRLTTVIEHATQMILITDPSGTIEYVNPAFQAITGYAPKEAIGRNPRMLQSGRHDRQHYREVWRTLRSGEPWSGRFINRRKDGQVYHQETTISPVTAPSGDVQGYVAIGHDVTHLVRLEERLRHTARMEALGTLTGGVAHDFNNILAVVLSSVDLALDSVPEGEAREALRDLRRTAESGTEMVRKLLVFGRHEPMVLEPLDVGDALEEMASTLRRLLPASIEMEVDIEPGLPPVRADRGALQQILMNLATNARDAIQETGRFRIEASATHLSEEDLLQFGELRPGDHVELSVSDTGEGMDAETRARVFDPFFTTKESGHGTGLGLATVYSLVRQHDGVVQVYSEPDVGTTFRIFLPGTTDDVPDAAEEADADARRDVSGAGRTVLVVEDDDALRRVSERMLKRLDFKVLTARNGEEGWRIFEEARGRIDVVVSDLVLPKLGGAELLERIHARDPELPLILSSGYASGEATETQKSVAGFTRYIQKPWTVDDLAGAIRRALD